MYLNINITLYIFPATNDAFTNTWNDLIVYYLTYFMNF